MSQSQAIFYGGKGGVGKTTCAAATALELADAGYETLVVSTDPAHSLADTLETTLESEPTRVRSSLSAVEIDADAQAERYERIATALAADLRSAGVRLSDEEVEQIFAAGAPAGSDELAALDLLVEYVDDGEWEYVVFDTAPTGHTLRLLDLPDVLGRTLETIRSLQSQVQRIGDSAKRLFLGPAYYATSNTRPRGDDLEALRDRLERARELLTDAERSEFRVVLVPETMAIAESRRLVETLETLGVPVETLVVNRVLEDEDSECSRCRSRATRHAHHLESIEATMPAYSIVTIPEHDGELVGLEALEAIGEHLPVREST